MRTIGALLGLFGLIASAWTQGTAFTYQGYLRQSGNARQREPRLPVQPVDSRIGGYAGWLDTDPNECVGAERAVHRELGLWECVGRH
jgi:hypothetical protein